MTKIKQTKTKTYINHNDEIFVTNNATDNRTITPANLAIMNDQQLAAINSYYNWVEIGKYDSVDAAYSDFINAENIKKAERKMQNDLLTKQIEENKAAEWASIKDMPSIPATLDNIRIVLEHLNNYNWGGWRLPKMSIGYKAAQFDCDGDLAAAITFHSPIDGTCRFKIGGRRGHLNKYRSL